MLNSIMREVYHDESPNKQQKEGLSALKEGIVKLDAEKLVPYHPLFKKLSLLAVKELLLYCMLIRAKIG